MAEKIEGTLILDGIIEGKVPFEGEHLLKEWISFAKENQILFNLQSDGISFNILADNSPINVSSLKNLPAPLIKNLLEEMIKLFPHGNEVFSTIRSIEYKSGKEIQTLYAVNPSGQISLKSREIEAETTEKPQSLTKRQNITMGLGMAAIVSLLLVLSSFFIDYRQIFSEIKTSATAIKVDELQIENNFYPYFRVASREKGKNGTLLLTIEKSTLFPLTDKDLDTLYKSAATLKDKLLVEALARKTIAIEYYSDDGLFITANKVRLDQLQNADIASAVLPYDNSHKPAKLILTY